MKETDSRDITLSDASLSQVVHVSIGRTVSAYVSIRVEVTVDGRSYLGGDMLKVHLEPQESLDELLRKA